MTVLLIKNETNPLKDPHNAQFEESLDEEDSVGRNAQFSNVSEPRNRRSS